MKNRFLIPVPPPCICGNNDYVIIYIRKQEVVRARCTKCGFDRYFKAVSDVWGPKNFEKIRSWYYREQEE